MQEYLETTIDKFVFRVATDCLYSQDGVWVCPLQGGGNRRVRLGITDYLQQRSGDVAFVHVKPVGTQVALGDELAEVETIKANVGLFAPLAGKVVEVNPALEPAPETVNQDPYGKGWLAVLEAVNWQSDRAELLDPQAYLALVRSQAQEELGQS